MLDVTVVIPNYNGKHFLKVCLDSIRKQSRTDFVTMVIDNGSSDGSVEYIRQEYPWVTVVCREKNYGFCDAVNTGIRLAQTSYVLLLNNDTEAEPGFVQALYEMISSDSRIFSVSSKMLNFKQRDLMDDAGDMYSIIGWQFQRGVGRNECYYQREKKIFSACAGAAIYRKAVFEEIGYFDEAHFAYLEDIDIGYRAGIYGYQNYFCPQARVYHVGSGTSADGCKYNEFKVRHSARNSVYLNYKNMPLLQLIINFPALTAGWLVKWIFFTRKGFGKVYIKAILEGFSTLDRVKKVPFRWEHLKYYGKLEVEMIANLALYVDEFVKRKWQHFRKF